MHIKVVLSACITAVVFHFLTSQTTQSSVLVGPKYHFLVSTDEQVQINHLTLTQG